MSHKPNRQAWVDHVFPNKIPLGWTANIRTRVRDTPIRLRHQQEQLEAAAKIDEAWNIKEHIGHLIDLEQLHLHRLELFANKEKVLSAADMSNRATYAANHSERSIGELLTDFEKVRCRFLEKFDALSDECLAHEAFHPRLEIGMRPVDMLFFVAEHDDHHLASIYEIIDQK